MKIYLAGGGWEKRLWMKDNFFDFYRLHTFYDIAPHEAEVISRYKGFLLDSGAFSFFGGKTVNWDDYVGEYIAFINKYNVKLFFELDIYAIVGVKKTEEIRTRLIKETGRKPIPVFHKRLGIDYYKMFCEQFKYIAISASGMYESKWTRQEPQRLKKMIQYANSKGVKVHGLGYTKLSNLAEMPFYSVDSTSWLSGNRFGGIYEFNGTGFNKHMKPVGKRVKTQSTAEQNFYEWVKYQKYADKML
tara:strand:- start:17109 stop:17843 length:735 start_codon:yes stop_codon:yes gene_type:complete